MWVSNLTPITIYRACVMVGVCTGKVEKEPEFRGERTTASLLGVQTNRYRHNSHLPEASETGGLLSQVKPSTNKLPDGDDGVHFYIGRPKAFGKKQNKNNNNKGKNKQKILSLPPTFTNNWQLVQKTLSNSNTEPSFLQYYYTRINTYNECLRRPSVTIKEQFPTSDELVPTKQS